MSSSSPQIVIVGAGLIGLSTADSLLSRGARVTLIDARKGPARGTSFANSGMIHPSQVRPWASDRDVSDAAVTALYDLAVRSRRQIGLRMNALGLTDALRRPRGCYQIFDDARSCEMTRQTLVTDGISVNRVETDPLFDRPTLFYPDDRSADAREYGVRLSEDLVARGATLIFDAVQTRLFRDEAGHPQIALGHHVFDTDAIVICAGAQSETVLSSLDISCPVKPVRGWAADFAWTNEALRSAWPSTPVMDAPSRSAFTPFVDRFRLSGTWGQESASPLLKRWFQLAPDNMRQAGRPLAIWSGLRPVSPLGRPFIGRTRFENLFVNTGHGHLGWTLCAGSGELLADILYDKLSAPEFALQ